MTAHSTERNVLEVKDLCVAFSDKKVFEGLSLAVENGEFIAILGPNGAGKTTFIKTILGLVDPECGFIQVLGQAPKSARKYVGYVPQLKALNSPMPMRAIDYVRMGVDGSKLGIGFNKKWRQFVFEAIDEVGGLKYANSNIWSLSGGELQRLRIAQALVSRPSLLMCDEALLSLDLKFQNLIISVIDNYRKCHNAAVLFVTHEINPILPYAHKVLYFANGSWLLGKPDEVLNSENLSNLFNSNVEVVKVQGRIVVVGVEETLVGISEHAHHEGG